MTTNTVESTAISAGQPWHLYFHVLTDSERAQGRSDAFADAALEWGTRGRIVTAEAYAELAEVYARLADVLEHHSSAAQGIVLAIPFDEPLYCPSSSASQESANG